jgi:hypothetical protein
MKEILRLPLYAEEVIDEYNNLRLGGKKVVCPYYMNTVKERAGLRALIGKGDPGEIEKEVLVWAKLKDFDLKKSSPKKIREFMIDRHIGVDCSGFVVHTVNFWLKNEGKKPLIHYLEFKNNSLLAKLRRFFRPVENISANTLTNELNCDKIDDLNQVRPGDFIRSKGKVKNSHHIMLISKVVKENGKVQEIEFTHASRTYDEHNGIRSEVIVVTKPKLSLSKQQWPSDPDGKHMLLDHFKVFEEDNGIRRLKKIELSFITN